MPNAVGTLFRQIREIWSHFGINQKVSLVIAVAAVAGIMGGILYWSARPSYALLYSGLSLEDAATAREKLADQAIPVELRDSGHAIYVPAGSVYRGRLLLASAGLPKKSTAGFELFEQPKFGLTDFAQKVNYQRALQGELERTIATMDGIESARVMLVLPSDRLFASDAEKKASASVMLNVASGAVPSSSQVRSIRQLVGSAVPGLSASAITITDQAMHMLSQRIEESESQMGAVNDQIEIQDRLENLLARKAQTMLDMALGATQAIVRVSATLDFSRVEKRREKFDSEGRVVASEKISSESSSLAASGGGGPAGVVAVKDPGNVTVDRGQGKSKKEDIATEYKVPSDVEHIVQNGITVKSVSVSVCVANRKRTPEQIKDIQGIVAKAVGIAEGVTLNDAVKVVEMDFPSPREAEKLTGLEKFPIPIMTLVNGVSAAVILLVIFLVSRRVIGRLSVQREEAGVSIGSLTGAGGFGMAGRGVNLSGPEQAEMALEQVAQLAEQNPRAVAAYITSVSKKGR